MLFHISALTIICALAFLAYYLRARLLPLVRPALARLEPLSRPILRLLPAPLLARLTDYTPLRSFSFADQAAAGMTSSAFDVEANNGEGSGEGRVGLDEAGVDEVRRIMAIERCTFDQARLIRHNRILAKNGIAPDGTPLDRKAVTRL